MVQERLTETCELTPENPPICQSARVCTWITGLIFFLAEKENRFVRFHAMQSLITFGGLMALYIVLGIIGGLFVLETVSVIVQVASFKLTGKRVFRMAPLHHHYEEKGWAEPTIVIRAWIVAVILAIAGLATLKLR